MRFPVLNMMRRLVAGALMIVAAADTAAAWPPFSKRPVAEQVFQITAKNSAYFPAIIQVTAGQPVVLEITAVDDDHGFFLRAFGVQADVLKGKTVRVRFIPNKVGTFNFHCDNWCGDFHDDMTGKLVVTE